jgi:glyoxylase-like metal-dependent hydrolase (beta-lactamase superfamily II)
MAPRYARDLAPPGIPAAIAFTLLAIVGTAGGTDSAARTVHSGEQSPPPLSDRVRTHVSSEAGILANAYLIETGDGVVAVDATLTVSDAKALRARLDALGRPLLAVLVTHGHPDHYNGLTQLVAGTSVPIITTAAVDRVIREWDAKKEAQWKPLFKDEWPVRRTFPNRLLQSGDAVSFGSVRFTVHDLGPGESHNDAYWVAEDGATRVAFIGDLAFNGEHSYVSDGHTGAWLANLERTEEALAGVAPIYPGHGPAGGLELLDQQRRYLQRYRDAVGGIARGRSTLTEAEKAKLTDVMLAFLPTGKLTFLIANGADAVAAELAAGRSRVQRRRASDGSVAKKNAALNRGGGS